MDIGKILGKFPWMSKIPFQGNGMAAIPKIKKIIKINDIRRLLPSHKFMLDFSFVLALPQVPNSIEWSFDQPGFVQVILGNNLNV